MLIVFSKSALDCVNLVSDLAHTKQSEANQQLYGKVFNELEGIRPQISRELHYNKFTSGPGDPCCMLQSDRSHFVSLAWAPSKVGKE
jgi:hypothetical protein